MTHSVSNKLLAVITGASSGIGYITAHALAQRGYRTILIARRAAVLQTLAERLSQHAPSLAIPLDLSEPDSLPATLQPVLEREGPVTVLVNCAGCGIYRPLLDQTPDEMRILMRVNHESALMLARLVVPGMLNVRAGHIFGVCSMAARLAPWGHAGYAASKCAMASVLECFAAEYPAHQTGVRFTVVFPGIINTPYFWLGGMDVLWRRVARRAILPERVAEAMCRCIGRNRLHLYVPWHYRLINVLSALTPEFAHTLVRRGSLPPGPVETTEIIPSPSPAQTLPAAA